MRGGRYALQGEMHGWGVCIAGPCAWQEGHAWQGRVCGRVLGRGGETDTEAGVTHPPGMLSCYRPQRSWGKVIFSQVSVILLTGGCMLPGGACSRGVPAPRGVVVSALGGCLLRGVPGGPPGTATAAGGTHPGMHSC